MGDLAEGDDMEVAPDYCRACDLARHICPGCGTDIEHGDHACLACATCHGIKS